MGACAAWPSPQPHALQLENYKLHEGLRLFPRPDRIGESTRHGEKQLCWLVQSCTTANMCCLPLTRRTSFLGDSLQRDVQGTQHSSSLVSTQSNAAKDSATSPAVLATGFFAALDALRQS